MQVTVAEIRDQIRHMIKKHSADSDITPQMIEMSVQQQFSALVAERERASFRGGKFDPASGMHYFRFSNIPVLSDGDEKYFELPATPSQSMASNDIRVSKDRSTPPYLPLPSGVVSIMSQATQNLGGSLGYILEGSRVYFVNHPFMEPPETVDVAMLAPIIGVNAEAYTMISADMQSAIIARVLKELVGIDQIPEDDVSNDVDQPS